MPGVLFDLCAGDTVVRKTGESFLSRSMYPLCADFPLFIILCWALLSKLQTYWVPSFWMFSAGFPAGTSDFLCRTLKAPSGTWGRGSGCFYLCVFCFIWCLTICSATIDPPVFFHHSLSLQVVLCFHAITWIWACFLPPLLRVQDLSSPAGCSNLPWLQAAAWEQAFRKLDPTVALSVKSTLWFTPGCNLQPLRWCAGLTHVLASACLSFFSASSSFIWIWTASSHIRQLTSLEPLLYAAASARWYSMPCPSPPWPWPFLTHLFC